MINGFSKSFLQDSEEDNREERNLFSYGNKVLDPLRGVLFEKLSSQDLGSLALTCSAANNLVKHRRILNAIVKGNEDAANKILSGNPELLRSKLGVVVDYSGRIIKDMTPLQAALYAGDIQMIEMMRPLFDKLVNGPALFDEQISEIFPECFDDHVKSQSENIFDFTDILNAIKGASAGDASICFKKTV